MKCYTWGLSFRFQSIFLCNLRQIKIYDNEHNQEGKVYSSLLSTNSNDQFETLWCFYTAVASNGALIAIGGSRTGKCVCFSKRMKEELHSVVCSSVLISGFSQQGWSHVA